MSRHPDISLGVVCLSIKQRDAVNSIIDDELKIRSLVEAFNPEEPIRIKSVEEIQGDERDVMLISIGYGFDERGVSTNNFGPVSRSGGERRLNVMISRARYRCVVYSSITAANIPADSGPRGTRMLRSFLHFAETGEMNEGNPDPSAGFDSPFEEAVANVIEAAGYTVHSQIGVAGFRIDLGVLSPVCPGKYLLGVECDGASYHSSRSARDRDRLRQEILEQRGWKLSRIWSTDWFLNPRRETERLLRAIRAAEAGLQTAA
jgi:very-short-patch-repair endonuclease